MFPIKYIDNNLVWNKDNEVFANYELIPYNYSLDRKSTRLNSSHNRESRMPSSA